VPDAGTNVTNLINKIFKQSPGTTVILTTILVNSIASQDACRVTINEQASLSFQKGLIAWEKIKLTIGST
jgi:hypothetical protein